MLKDNLRNLRKEFGFSQKDLAEKLNVSFKTISHWEGGYTEPPISIIIKIKKLFNVTYEEIIE